MVLPWANGLLHHGVAFLTVICRTNGLQNYETVTMKRRKCTVSFSMAENQFYQFS